MTPIDILPVRVYYEDTDAGGVVYYASYLRFFERARTEFFRVRELSVADYMDQGIFFMVGRLEIDYRLPGRYDDLLDIQTHIGKFGKANFVFHHRVRQHDTGRIVAEGNVRMVCADLSGKPRRLPQEILAEIKRAARPQPTA
jgi:acyl-CoA thioester hydrolase